MQFICFMDAFLISISTVCATARTTSNEVSDPSLASLWEASEGSCPGFCPQNTLNHLFCLTVTIYSTVC